MPKLVGTFFNLSIPNLSKLDFKLAKSIYLANVYVSTPVAFCKSAFAAQLSKSNLTFNFPPENFGSGNY